jgi:hypothetical protein
VKNVQRVAGTAFQKKHFSRGNLKFLIVGSCVDWHFVFM